MQLLRLVLFPSLVLLGACGGTGAADPSGMTRDEAQELNDAAAMLAGNAMDANASSSIGNRP